MLLIFRYRYLVLHRKRTQQIEIYTFSTVLGCMVSRPSQDIKCLETNRDIKNLSRDYLEPRQLPRGLHPCTIHAHNRSSLVVVFNLLLLSTNKISKIIILIVIIIMMMMLIVIVIIIILLLLLTTRCCVLNVV